MDYNGIYYSLLDRSYYGSLGRVHKRNQILLSSDSITEKMISVRHGNGTDWWVIAHLKESNTFVKFVCKSDSIYGPYYQSIGTAHSENNLGLKGQMCISNNGTKVACVAGNGLIEVFNFDRSTGMLSNPVNISDNVSDFYGCSISPNNQFLYVSNRNFDGTGVSSIYQYDLFASNITNSKVLLCQLNDTNYHFGQHKIGPDGKIYVAKYNGPQGYDVAKDSNNTYLSVINVPDKWGTFCQFSLNGLYLNGRMCTGGLPNIPNYQLGMIPEVAMQHPVEYPDNSQEIDNPYQSDLNGKDVNIAVPNHFTPNQDGISDVFSVTADQLQKFEISVYSINGAMVYHSTNQYDSWNGSYGNVYSQTGIYVYAIKYTSQDGIEAIKTGKVLLTR
jgi:gliding motility-associated-like protein